LWSGGDPELKLVVLAHGPRFDAPFSERLREFLRETVQREHAFRLNGVDEAQQVRKIRVIGKRERSIALITIDRSGIGGPTRDHSRAPLWDLAYEKGVTRLRWTDHHMSGDFVVREITIRWEGDPELLVNARELEGLRVQHYRKFRRGETTQQLLALAEAVAE
jgi:hypothetical protein